ncbi:MAG: hypothetical protein V3T72_17460 [Thermoanaerobaculia bacterium]
MYRPILTFALLIALSTGCADRGSSSDEAPAADGAGEENPAPAAAPEFAPITTHGGGTGGGGTEVTLPGATFELPGDWQQQAPSSSMRAAQAEIPGAAGAGQLTVFFFGVGGGGGTESNLQRWIGQVEVDPASPPVREVFSGDGTRVSWVEARGTLKPSTMGTGPTSPQPDSMLLGGVVEGAGGPWYFKATGPGATMEAQKDAFLAMLGSVKPAAGG